MLGWPDHPCLFHRRDELPRDGTADDRVHEQESRAAAVAARAQPSSRRTGRGDRSAPLTLTALSLYGLAVGDLGHIELHLDAELALEPLDGGFEVDPPDPVTE